MGKYRYQTGLYENMAEESWQLLYRSSNFLLQRNIEAGVEVYCYFFFSASERDEFLESKQAAISLQHPHIASIRAYSRTSQGLYHLLTLETDLCPSTLETEIDTRLSESRLWSPFEAISTLQALLSALQYAYSQVKAR